jgi:hypothetical protein
VNLQHSVITHFSKTDYNIVTCQTEGHRYYATLLSLLGNRNIAMDTLTTPVFLRCMVTNSWKASVSIVAGSVKEGNTIHEVSLRQLVFGVLASESVQCSSDSRIQEATSASFKLLPVVVMCAAVNLQSESIRYPIQNLVELVTPPLVHDILVSEVEDWILTES